MNKKINKFKDSLDLCKGVQFNKDVRGWNTLHKFENTSTNKDFDAKVYKQGNNIVIAFAGTNMKSKNDLRNDIAI